MQLKTIYLLLLSAVKQTAQLFGEIADAKSSLISKSSHIQNELISIQKALEAIHTECKSSGGSSLCDEIPFGKDVETEADFNKVCDFVDRNFHLLIVTKNYCSRYDCHNSNLMSMKYTFTVHCTYK